MFIVQRDMNSGLDSMTINKYNGQMLLLIGIALIGVGIPAVGMKVLIEIIWQRLGAFQNVVDPNAFLWMFSLVFALSIAWLILMLVSLLIAWSAYIVVWVRICRRMCPPEDREYYSEFVQTFERYAVIGRLISVMLKR